MYSIGYITISQAYWSLFRVIYVVFQIAYALFVISNITVKKVNYTIYLSIKSP
jgi:hypothetical protein